jgi:hypothetical protein
VCLSCAEIAETMIELENCETIEPNKLRMLFNELVQICLWLVHYISNDIVKGLSLDEGVTQQ